MTKHIFVTGGVVSSLGKGVTTASVGFILERMGYRVALQKLDPYINVDPGTMNPIQHGEVYVTEDGAETDLDLGHYERFTNGPINTHSNYTTGRIYSSVIAKERRGEYLGQTVQVIPHITDEIQSAIRAVEGPGIDIAITEVGGTVGDIEGLPYLEAIRQFALAAGRRNVLFIHLTLIPYLRASQEIKTKPTQQSVSRLREIGIQPDILICRTEKPLREEIRSKLSLFCNVEQRAVLEERDVETSIYEIPGMLRDQGLHRLACEILSLPEREPRMDDWEEMLRILRNPEAEITTAVVGKYLEVHDAYKSVWESLAHAGIANRCRVNYRKIDAEDVEVHGMAPFAEGIHGILIPGGFGKRGIEGKIAAVRYARENRIPFLGLCLGMQVASIEFARNVIGLRGANSTEFDSETPHPVVHLMETQRGVVQKGGTLRLGTHPCRLEAHSRAHEAYGTLEIRERHRHRYEFNNRYRARFLERGSVFSGIHPDLDLVEIFELKDHPWFVGVQFHPEFQSKPTAAHPLFTGFVRACLEFRG